MKSFVLILCMVISVCGFSQPEMAIAMRSGFDGGSGVGSNTIGSQFFTSGWANGSIKLTDNKTIEDDILLIYDKVRQELFVKPRSGGDVVQVKKESVENFIIESGKHHEFVNNAKYGLANDDGFCEIIIKNDSGFTLLKTIRTRFLPKDFKDVEMVADIKDEYKDYVTYFLSYKGGAGSKIKLKSESIRKAFGEEKERLVESILGGRLEINERDLIGVVERVNKNI